MHICRSQELFTIVVDQVYSEEGKGNSISFLFCIHYDADDIDQVDDWYTNIRTDCDYVKIDGIILI